MDRQLTRRERDRERSIAEILDAAEAVFAEKGYERARMSDIARRAEFSVGYLYQTWKGKEDLYVCLLEAKSREFKSYLEDKIQAAPGPAEKIEALIDAHLAFIDRNKRFARIFLVDTNLPARPALTRLSARLRRAHADHFDLVEDIFGRGVRCGAILPVDPHDLALALDGIIFAFAKDNLARSPAAALSRKGPVIKRIFFEAVARSDPPRNARKKRTRKKESRKS